MKNKFTIYILLFIIATLTGIFITSCDIKNPTEGLEVRIKTISRTSQINVSFIDGATGEDLQLPVTITFTGRDQGDVISEANEQISSLVANDGSVIFSLTDALIPTEENPVDLILIAEADGYIKTSKRVLIRQPFSSFDINMTNISGTGATPTGVSTTTVAEGRIDAADNGVTQTVVVTTPPPTQGGGGASVVIPIGTTLLDKSGNALSGDIKTNVTYFNPNEEQSIQSFPGGLDDITISNRDGSEEQTSFITAGFVSIDMTVNNVPVEGFGGQGIEINIEIPSGTYNPEEERDVQTGDIIPLWSYNEDTGEWLEEGTAEVTVVPGRGGSKNVVTLSNIKHLSWWNLDWKDRSVRCGPGKEVIFDGCFGRLYLRIKNGDTGEYLKSYARYINGASSYYRNIKFYNSPNDIDNVILEFYNNYYDKDNGIPPVGTQNIGNLCEQTTVNIDMAAVTNFRTIRIRLIAKCTQTDPARVVYPEGKTLWYKKQSGGSWINAGSVDALGWLEFCLEENVKYWFRSYIDGKYYYSYDYDDVFEMLEPGKTEYIFEVEDPDVGNFCN